MVSAKFVEKIRPIYARCVRMATVWNVYCLWYVRENVTLFGKFPDIGDLVS